jgi:hypothetical protein
MRRLVEPKRPARCIVCRYVCPMPWTMSIAQVVTRMSHPPARWYRYHSLLEPIRVHLTSRQSRIIFCFIRNWVAPTDAQVVLTTHIGPAEERDYREADFGLDDPGVTVITADKGGFIPYCSRNREHRWVVDGYCNSACTMVLGTGRVCATPRARFNFHAGYYKYFGYWNVITPQWTYQMYQHYPDDVRAWVDAHHAMDQIRLTTMQQPEVATYPAAEPLQPVELDRTKTISSHEMADITPVNSREICDSRHG